VENATTAERQKIACHFPARVRYVDKATGRKTDLSHCKDLQSFLSRFQDPKVKIALASEMLGSPTSSFGHIMLVIQSSGDTLESSAALHFSAVIAQRDDLARYIYKGLSGGYEGQYILEPLFKKMEEYLHDEQRSLTFYDTDYTKEEINLLLLHVYELKHAKFEYYFFDLNCAHRMQEVLDLINGEQARPPRLFMTPKEIIINSKPRLKERITYLPSSIRVAKLFNKLQSKEKFHKVVSGETKPSKQMTSETKEALHAYYQYEFKTKSKVLPFYQDVRKLQFPDSELNLKSNSTPNLLGSQKLSVSNYWIKDQQHLGLSFRPASHSIDETQPQINQESKFELLTTNLIFYNGGPEIIEFSLLSASTYRFFKPLIHPISWTIFSGLNRENSENRLTWENEFGAGLTWNIGKTFISPLLITGLDSYSNKQLGYGKLSILVASDLSSTIKVGLEAFRKIQSETYSQQRFFLTKQLGQWKIGSELKYQKNIFGSSQKIYLDYHF